MSGVIKTVMVSSCANQLIGRSIFDSPYRPLTAGFHCIR
jgi:hypothetical protein